MNTSLTVATLRRQSWALMIQEQIHSGLSVREWCQQNGIAPKTYYYRRKQVQSMVLEEAQPAFTELVPPADTVSVPENTATFIPQLSITLNGMTINVSQSTPKQLLADALEVIRNA